MTRLLFFVPGFSGRNVLFKAGVSIILAAFMAFAAYVRFDAGFALLRDAVLYDPYEYASELVAKEQFRAADDFLSFYKELPGAEFTDALETLHRQVQEKRSGILYQGQKAVSGFFQGESDEDIGQALAFGSEFFFIGDLRDIGREAIKFAGGEEVDSLTLGLSTIGLGMSAMSFWGPQAAAAVPAKAGLSFFKRASKFLSKSLRRHIDEVAELAGRLARKQLEHMGNSAADAARAVKELKFSRLKTARTRPLNAVEALGKADAQKMTSAFKVIGDTGQLALKDRRAAAFVVRHSDDFAVLGKNADLASRLPRAGIMLENGGMNVLRAAEKHTPSLIQSVLAYGKSGVSLLVLTGSDAFKNKVRWMKLATSGRIWFHLQNFVTMLPLPVLGCAFVYAMLIMLKMWRGPYRQAAPAA